MLVCLGFGYTALHFVRHFSAIPVAGSVRSREKQKSLQQEGLDAFLFKEAGSFIARATHLLVSAAPDEQGDPVLRCFGSDVRAASDLQWIGYLSTTAVYGDHQGGWVAEDMAVAPLSQRGCWRVAAEDTWLEFGTETGKAVQIFRLSGIYGPGRNALENLKEGTAKRLIKPGQVFNRIHVEDIAQALRLSIYKPQPGAIYNLADDEPAPPQDVVTFAAQLLKQKPPTETPFDPQRLSPMAASFYSENKRVSNARIKRELGWKPLYPTYREGLKALFLSRTGEG